MSAPITHLQAGKTILELPATQAIPADPREALELFAGLAYGTDGKLIAHQQSFTPEFFELRTRMAGELLQKLTNFRMQLAIVGDFTNVASQSLKAFVIECNRGQHFFFVPDVETAKAKLAAANPWG